MIELSEEQRQALTDPEPVAIDPQTKQVYVLVRKDLYDRLRALLDEDLPDAAALVNEVMAEDDHDDPLLESYQKYRGPHEAR